MSAILTPEKGISARPYDAIDFIVMVAPALICAAGCRDQEQFPNRPITLVCPWSAGGGTDRVSREVAALLEDELEVPVNVINATGGSGVTGHTRGALAKPDGYTITMITVELNMLHWRGFTKIDYHYFDPLVLLNRDAAAVFVRSDAPWQTLGDLERDIRQAAGIEGVGNGTRRNMAHRRGGLA